jgi:hypothetical protein
MTEHKNLKRLIRERQARTGESYSTARSHVISDRPVVVLVEMDLGDQTVRAVRGRPSDELRETIAANGVTFGAELIEIRFGGDLSGQPVLSDRPSMIILGEDRVLAFGLLPAVAVSAEAVSPNGERASCTVGPGVWLTVLPDTHRGAELIPVLFRDHAGKIVNPGLPADWDRQAVGARDIFCPACGSNEWDVVTAGWQETGAMRNTRWGRGSSGPGRAFVCGVCGHEERVGTVIDLDRRGKDRAEALLRDAQGSFQSVQITINVWRDHRREAHARRVDIEAARRRGGSVTSYSPVCDGELSETVESILVWSDANRLRLEVRDGPRDGFYGVAVEDRWWTWDPRAGARTGESEPNAVNHLLRPFDYMLDPGHLARLLDLRLTGRSQVLGRATLTAQALPLPPTGLAGVTLALYPLGAGADQYRFEIDEERGVLLSATALHDGQPIQTRSVSAIRFDEPIPAMTFDFEAPEGEEVLSAQHYRKQ